VPLFVRHGALIPVCPVRDTVGDGPFTDVTLVSYGGTDARTVVSDVDGDTVVTALRDGEVLQVTTEGPLRVAGVALAPVTGPDLPRQATLNGVPVAIDEVR